MQSFKTSSRNPASSKVWSFLFRALFMWTSTTQVGCKLPQGNTRIDLRSKHSADEVELTSSISQTDATGLALTSPGAPIVVATAFGRPTNCLQFRHDQELVKKSESEFGLRVPRSCATSELEITRIQLDVAGEILDLQNDSIPVAGRTAQFSFDGRILTWEGLSQDVVTSAQVKAARANISATIQITQNEASLCTDPTIHQDEQTGNVKISLKMANALPQVTMPGMGGLTSLLPDEGDVLFSDASPYGIWTWDISALEVGQHTRNLTLRSFGSNKQCEFAATIVVQDDVLFEVVDFDVTVPAYSYPIGRLEKDDFVKECMDLINQNPSAKLMCFTCETNDRETCSAPHTAIAIPYTIIKTDESQSWPMNFEGDGNIHFSKNEAILDCIYNMNRDSSVRGCTLGGEVVAGLYTIQTPGTLGAFIGNLVKSGDEAYADCASHCSEAVSVQPDGGPIGLECRFNIQISPIDVRCPLR